MWSLSVGFLFLYWFVLLLMPNQGFHLCLNISSRAQIWNYDGIFSTPCNFTYPKKKNYSLLVLNIIFKKWTLLTSRFGYLLLLCSRFWVLIPCWHHSSVIYSTPSWFLRLWSSFRNSSSCLRWDVEKESAFFACHAFICIICVAFTYVHNVYDVWLSTFMLSCLWHSADECC